MIIKHTHLIRTFFQSYSLPFLSSSFSSFNLHKIQTARTTGELIKDIQKADKNDPLYKDFLKKFTLLLKKEDKDDE